MCNLPDLRSLAQPPKIGEREVFVAGDSLGRELVHESATSELDGRWLVIFGLFQEAELRGYVQAEKERIFSFQSTDDSDWEQYNFGSMVDFPWVDGDDSQERAACQTRLLTVAIDELSRDILADSEIFCLIPAEARLETKVVEAAGFVWLGEFCLDQKLLEEKGFGKQSEVRAYRRNVRAARPARGFTPWLLMGNDHSRLAILSNHRTKTHAEPTFDFWSSIRPYTTFSAYPLSSELMRDFLELTGAEPRRILLSPCGSGDFLRFWPKDLRRPEMIVSGVDIRQDLLDLARLRLRFPSIDDLNLHLCAGLAQAVRGEEISSGFVDAVSDLISLFWPGSSAHFERRQESLRLFARMFDQLLTNHAIPDWFFPLKALAVNPGESGYPSIERLVQWIEANIEKISRAPEVFPPHDDWEGGHGAAESALESAQVNLMCHDLMKIDWAIDSTYDLILCWEFVHVLRSSSEVATFLQRLVTFLAPGGMILLTSIREAESIVPSELQEAREILEALGVETRLKMLDYSAKSSPFSSRLNFWYPVLIGNT